MVTVTINGRKNHREFRNMAQALMFASMNGDCINAEKVELAYESKTAAKTGSKGNGNAEAPKAEK